jgi:hypothetical protein
MEHFQHDSDYIARKLEITPNEFKSYLKHKGLDSNFFLSNNNIYKVLKKLQSIIERITKKKISNYS